MATLEALLPDFKLLDRLVVHGTPPEPARATELDDDFARVSKWSTLCPTLTVANLSSEVAWGNVRGVWLPGDAACALSWLVPPRINSVAMAQLKWFFRKVLMSEPPLSDTHLCIMARLIDADSIRTLADTLSRGAEIPDFVLERGSTNLGLFRVVFSAPQDAT